MKKSKRNIKRIVFLMLILVLSVGALSVGASAATPYTGKVNASNVNLRTTRNANISTNILGLVQNGDKVAVSDYGFDAWYQYNWYWCDMTSGQNSGKSGWIVEQYITID